jgi:hypothetical protein
LRFSRSTISLCRDRDAAAQAGRTIARSVEASGFSLCKLQERHPMSSTDLAGIQQTQQQMEDFETQLAKMQMQFQMKMEAAKEQKAAAEALGNQQG